MVEKQLTTRLPEGEDLPRCNNTEIDWYKRMLTGPAPVDSTDEMQHGLCEEEGVAQDPTNPKRDSQLPNGDG